MGNPHRDKDRRRRRDDTFGNRMEDAFARYGRIDVSVDGQRRDNRGDRNRDRDRGRPERGNERPPRPRLEFTELLCLERGDCRCRITAADGYNGRFYNFTVERQNRDRPTRFFREGDADDLLALIKQTTEWIEQNRGA